MKSLVYLLLMLLTAAISDATENENSSNEEPSKCIKSKTECTVKTVCVQPLEWHVKKCIKPEEIA